MSSHRNSIVSHSGPRRLLNTTTLELKEFGRGERRPPYAILTHRWGDDEITFREMMGRDFNTQSSGYLKVENTCQVAQDLGIEWAWLDTCCIDKSSSQELTDAMEAMYDWYAEAKECFGFLADVHVRSSNQDLSSLLRRAEWFTRGWTLQELLAPRDITFFGKDWSRIGTKSQLSSVISQITGIPMSFLNGSRHPQTASVAQRISWSAGRKLTVPSDRAYCLVGLLGIQMQRGGENERAQSAFRRLQIQALELGDESLFAWCAHDCTDDGELFGVFARLPEDFADSGEIRHNPRRHCPQTRLRYEQSNHITFTQVRAPEDSRSTNLRMIVLGCSGDDDSRRVEITLQRISGIWYRIHCTKLRFCFSRPYDRHTWNDQSSQCKAFMSEDNRDDLRREFNREQEEIAREQLALQDKARRKRAQRPEKIALGIAAAAAVLWAGKKVKDSMDEDQEMKRQHRIAAAHRRKTREANEKWDNEMRIRALEWNAAEQQTRSAGAGSVISSRSSGPSARSSRHPHQYEEDDEYDQYDEDDEYDQYGRHNQYGQYNRYDRYDRNRY